MVHLVHSVTDPFDHTSHRARSPRGWIRAFGVVLLIAPAAVASAQGRCGGDRAGTSACDTTPAKLPFAPTGWKTVALDHFTMQASDYKKETAYYATLMNWKVRSDDGTKAILDIGDIGSVEIRGGFQAPPPPPPAPPPTAADSAAGRAGRGGGGARAPRRVVWDSFCWVISPWNAKTVEAELEKRGLNPVADNDGTGFESFHVKDPDGFDVQISNDAHLKARKSTPADAKLPAPAPFQPTDWKTVWLDHISFGVTNYKESTAFYTALLGWKPTGDEGSQNEVEIGDLGNIIIRGGNPLAPPVAGRGGAAGAPATRRASMDHISFGISPWDTDKVKAELDKRGLTGRADTGGKGDIHDPAAKYKSYHTTTPDGFDLQISNATKGNRTVR
jgi:catechol 2,3-dioxygenase-like lactoylglutathione lyase family enzyme